MVEQRITTAQPTAQELSVKAGFQPIEYRLLDMAAHVESLSQESKDRAMRIVKEIAEFSQNFDYVLVTGESRRISRALLQAAGVDPQKIISLNAEENAQTYKLASDGTDPDLEERRQNFRNILTKKGINPDQSFSMCVVDDAMKSGRKAVRICDLLAGLPEITRFAFTAFSPFREAEAPTVIGDKFYNADNLSKALFVPASTGKDLTEVDFFFDKLAILVSEFFYPSKRSQYSETVLRVSKNSVKSVLNDLYVSLRNMRESKF